MAGDAVRGARGRRSLWLAFHVVQQHDGDFERLEIGAGEVRLEARDARSRDALRRAPAVGARGAEGARVRGARCGSRMQGRRCRWGGCCPTTGRRELAAQLRGRVRVTAELRDNRKKVLAMPLKHLRAVAAVTRGALARRRAFADYMIDILPPATPIAQQIYDLHFGILWVCVGIFIVVFGAMFWSVFKHRRSQGAQAAQFHENTTIEVIWTVSRS